ncbi:MAG: carbohydrate kinase family protein [Acidobacteriaceae bacterium]
MPSIFDESASRRFDITIAGEINLDLILYGLPEQMPLERELLASGFEIALGSSSAILAHNIATLGTRVGFVTRVGPDDLGKVALERLAESGVDLSQIRYAEGGSGTGVTVLLHHGGQRRILTYPGTMAEMTLADLDMEYLCSGRHFHLSSLFLQKALQPDLPRLFAELKRAGLTISLDTNDDPDGAWDGVLDELLDMIDVLLPNQAELKQIARKSTVEEALAVLSRRVPLVVVKRGPEGALVQQGDVRESVPGITVQPVDTIGAGDSFNAGFLSAYLRGESPLSCAAMGNLAGALSTLRPGGTEAFRDARLRQQFLAQHTP